MGGHGGLNILPQKSWNVYGRKNRLKVARDEEAEAKKQEEERVKAEQIHREARITALQEGQRPVHTAEVNLKQSGRHINFWAEWESGSGNDAVNEAAKAERRKRGDELTQTSDAKFDERFQMMHGLTGPLPWYARTDFKADGDATPRSAPQRDLNVAATAVRQVLKRPLDMLDADREDEASRRSKKKRKTKKHDDRKHSKDKDPTHKKHKLEKDALPSRRKSIETLRQERLQREAIEAQRTQAIVRGAYR